MNNSKEIFDLIIKEENRQLNGIELIASENFTSPHVMKATGSVLTNKYAEGYPGKRYYGGCEVVDEIETIAIDRAKELFGASYANVQPHSGSQANTAVYHAFLKPGDKILGFDLSHGGHLTHGSPVNFSGRLYNPCFYGVNKSTGELDYDNILNIPIPHCHVVTTTTHKTLRGPRGGLILMGQDFDNPFGLKFKSGKLKKMSSLLDLAVFPGNQGGPLEHVIAGKAIAFGEALTDEFMTYMVQVRQNAKSMAKEFIKRDYKIISGGTDNHMMLIDLRNKNISGKDAELALVKADITANKNMVPFDDKSPFVTSGIRFGTPAITTRGLKEIDMIYIVELIDLVINNYDDDKVLNEVRSKVNELMKGRPLFN